MNSAMDIRRETKDSQLDSRNLKNVRQFNPTKFNADVLDAIKRHKAKYTSTFKDPVPTCDDLSILLHIILKAYLKECWMDRQACKEYLSQHQSLMWKLLGAYLTQEFNTVLQSELPLEQARQVVSRPMPSGGSVNHGLKWAFEQPYRGNTAQLFIKTLDTVRRSYKGASASKRPYNWSIAVVQSSGMGKSRMVDEAAKAVFTIPINIREHLPEGKLTYPPSDKAIRQFFEARIGKDDKRQQAEYAILLRVLFTETRNLVQTLFSELPREDLANAWANYLKEGQTEEGLGQNRRKFYEKVVRIADERIKEKDHTRGYLDQSLRDSCEQLVKVIQQTPSTHTNACFIYFDEAHSLIGGVRKPSKEHNRSPYDNLGTVLSKLIESRVFFIFLSTDSRIQAFAPPPSSNPSDGVTQGTEQIPAFTELSFDLYEDEVLDNIGPWTLENLCKTEVLVGFGRALWYTQYKSEPHKNIFVFALDKISACSVDKHEHDALLAALDVRIGITFDETHPASYSTQSRLVEWHLSVVCFIPRHRGYMHTGAPSEPVLAEAASRYLNGSRFQGVATAGPRWLSSYFKNGMLARGEHGDVVGRLLVTSAHDIALGDSIDLLSPEPQYHRPVPVLDFLRALFHENHHSRILESMPLADRGTQTLSEAFSESYVFFSHFARAEDSEMLSMASLAAALLRGMAIQDEDGQASIDAVIPIHMGSLTTPISPKTTSAINLQFRNRKKPLDFPIDRSVTVSNVEMPVISIIFEFGVTDVPEPVTIAEQTIQITRIDNQLHRDDRHYQIVAYGCNSAVFRSIPPEMESEYAAILGGRANLQDFPRYDDKECKEAFLAMSPALSGVRMQQRYSKLSKLETRKDTV